MSKACVCVVIRLKIDKVIMLVGGHRNQGGRGGIQPGEGD